MTKVYEALKEAEAERQRRAEPLIVPAASRGNGSAQRGAAAPTDHVADDASSAQRDLATLREIVFGSLFSEFEQAMARIEQRIEAESDRLRGEVGELERRLAERLTAIDARHHKTQGELRDQLLSQSNQLSDAIQERAEQSSARIEAGLRELRESKIDRDAFSRFLGGLAAHIGQQREESSRDGSGGAA